MGAVRDFPEATRYLQRSEAKVFDVGRVGTGFIAKAHSEAYVTMPMCFPDTPAKLHLKAIADVNADLARTGAERFGFDEGVAGWEKLINRADTDLHTNFFDGWKNHLIMEAVLEADKRQAWVPVLKANP